DAHRIQLMPDREVVQNDCDISSRQWIVAQIGARQHYTVPIGFEQLGRLHTFYTDLWCRAGHSVLRWLSSRTRALAGRYSSSVPSEKVVAFTWDGLCGSMKNPRPQTVEQQYLDHIQKGRHFSEMVNRHLL